MWLAAAYAPRRACRKIARTSSMNIVVGVSSGAPFADVDRVANSVIGATVALPGFALRFFANLASTMHAIIERM